MGRPKACGEVVNNIFIFAAFVLILPWLVEAQQQQRPALKQHESRPEVVNPEVVRTPLEATKIKTIETAVNLPRRKNTLSLNAKTHNRVDVSADSAPLAPSHPANSGSLTTGWGSSQPSARDLQDWEVEDFVLLATVDGSVWARDRRTGKQKWRMNLPDVSMISTKHYRRNRSSALDEGYISSWTIDDYVWIVEPTEHGGLWIYRPDVPNGGLVNTGLTMKKLVDEMSPYQSDDPEVVYTGSRKTQMVHIDATNGKVLQVFGGDYVVETKDESCTPNDNFMGRTADECQNPTLWLGLSRYKVDIVGKDTRPIATLIYNEWGPNVQDAKKYGDKYHETLDSKYILAGQDGQVMGFDRDRGRDHEFLFQQKLPSPVVRVFDIFRPWGTEKNPKLMMLPQPKPQFAAEDELLEMDQGRNSRVVINLSADGSFYAMSGKSYPLAVAGSQAQCYQRGRWKHESWQNLDEPELAEALTGIHCIDEQNEPRLTISGPLFEDNQSKPSVPDLAPGIAPTPSIVQSFQRLPRLAIDSVIEFVKNPVLFLFLMILLISYQREIRAWIGRHGLKQRKATTLSREDRSLVASAPQKSENRTAPALEESSTTRLPDIPEDEVVKPTTQDDAGAVLEPQGTKPVLVAPVEDMLINDVGSSSDVVQETSESLTASPEKKKERKRGRRGGVKHKKQGNRATGDSDKDTPRKPVTQKPPPTVEDAVRDAQNMFPQRKLEPDIQTVSNDPAEVSGPIIRIGALEVDQDKLVGTGSNGTMVFEGKFDGRAVAVKRMLIQFYDIASQETKLLRESDDHPNVIRYFAQQQAAGFLYIALELCPASLADVIEKPHLHRELARGGEKDLPNVLYQIANGLQHLHNLRIVHRDLKPQNILVAMGKNGKPRLLVSDFGLCKKLEGEQSSFRATTAHAAGTSGWRAPELLLDDDVKQGAAMIDTSTDGGGSGSILVSSDVMPNRRATRAIDIFSLGLVFFYVLTKGSHPFDCGDRYMREVNIRKDNFNLAHLEVLGDYAYEAKDLIASMLAKEPKSRPVAQQVMAHPFFWSAKKRLNFLCDVSDHFEKEKRDPPSPALQELEKWAPDVCQGDFLKPLGKEFVDSLGKQRKYTGTRLLDLLRALRNKKNHYEDMPDKLKKDVGPLPDGYLSFWTRKFPNLLIVCWNVIYEVQWDEIDRFREYYEPAGL